MQALQSIDKSRHTHQDRCVDSAVRPVGLTPNQPRLAPSVAKCFIIGANRLPIEISPIHLTA